MAIIAAEHRLTQLPLFGECLALPQWCDLTQPARIEVVRLLAQLLANVHECNAAPTPGSRGERNE